MAQRELRLSWWIEGGRETCPSCLQPYAYEAEYRYTDCDAPIYPICVEFISSDRMICPDCCIVETHG